MKIRSRFFSVSPMYLSTTVARFTVYRSRPRSPAITSAAIVLPVPESPANRAVTPVPRPPPGRIRQSDSTRSRLRARVVNSRSCLSALSGRTMSCHDTAGSTRRASRSRPAAFCDRAPRRRSRSTGVPRVESGKRLGGRDRRRDLARPEDVLCGDVADVDAVGQRAEFAPPQLGPFRDGQPGRLGDQWHPIGPVRIPCGRAGQHDRHRQLRQAEYDVDGVYAERLDGRYDQARAAQERFASQHRHGARHIAVGSQPCCIAGYYGVTRGPQRIRRDRSARIADRFVDIAEPLAGLEGLPEFAGLAAVMPARFDEHIGQRRVRRVGAEKVGGDAIRHPYRARQERPVGVVDHHQ